MLDEKRKAYKQAWYLDHSKGIKRRPTRLQIPCAICGTVLSLQPNQVRERNYCGYACRNKAYTQRRGEKSPRWKGGKRINNGGYIELRLQPDDFFYPMMSIRHYVLEHRLVMAKHLNRCLLPWEVVHHINGIKDDNRLENLKLLGSNGVHNTMLNKWCLKLQKENAELKRQLASV